MQAALFCLRELSLHFPLDTGAFFSTSCLILVGSVPLLFEAFLLLLLLLLHPRDGHISVEGDAPCQRWCVSFHYQISTARFEIPERKVQSTRQGR